VKKINKRMMVDVTDIEDTSIEGRMVVFNSMGGTERIAISFYALILLFKFACRSGIILPASDTFYLHHGTIRRYKRAENKTTAT